MKPPQPLHWLQRIAGHVPKFQPRVGKWPMAVVLAGLQSATSCTSGPPAAAAPGAPAWSGNETAAYRAGHKDGSGAQRQGRPAAPRPGTGSGREDYLSGYELGYRHPHDNPWSRPRAYQLGHQQGQRDRHHGHPPDPAQGAGAVPRGVRDEYFRGYRDGWQ